MAKRMRSYKLDDETVAKLERAARHYGWLAERSTTKGRPNITRAIEEAAELLGAKVDRQQKKIPG